MSKTLTHGSDHDKVTTSATAHVAIRSNNSSCAKTIDLTPNFGISEHVGVAQQECAPEQTFVALVLKNSQATPDILKDCEFLSDTVLNSKYPGEYQSWRNMKRRCKDGTRQMHPAFAYFRTFLVSVGAKPKRAYTLDRPDNANIEYSPTNARWASKREQNRNKSDTVIVTCPKTGKKWFAAQLAKKHSTTPDTIRAQRRRGWTDAEIIAGHRLPEVACVSTPTVKAATTLEADWHHAMVKYYPERLAALSIGAKKMLRKFEDVCLDAAVPSAEVLTVVIAHWIEFTLRAASENGLRRDRLPEIPQARFLAAYPGGAIHYWAKQAGCIWKHGRPILPPEEGGDHFEPTKQLPMNSAIPPEPVQLIAQVTKPDEPKMTMDELLEILNGDD